MMSLFTVSFIEFDWKCAIYLTPTSLSDCFALFTNLAILDRHGFFPIIQLATSKLSSLYLRFFDFEFRKKTSSFKCESRPGKAMVYGFLLCKFNLTWVLGD